MLDYLALTELPFLEGISLRHLIETDTQLSRTLFAEATFFQNAWAIIRNDLKYIGNRIPPLDLLNFDLLLGTIRSFYKFHGDELYRIDRDLDEMLNLLKAEPEIASRMQIDLLEHIRSRQTRQQMEMDKKTVEQLRSLGYVQ